MYINPCLLKDFYKVGHVDQYPEGTELVFSNFTPRKSRMPGINHSVFFGLKYFINEYLINGFEKFFNGVGHLNYDYVIKETLGVSRAHTHIYDLHYQGYLPLAIYALPEGAIVPAGVPALVMFNTKPEFYWLTNMLETILSCTLWGQCTSATIAREYRLLLDSYAVETSSCPEFVDYQAHDFSFRGMFGLEAAMMSGAAHLQYFKGTDIIPAILFRYHYYDGQLSCGTSVPATEHSVMSAGGKENEYETCRRLIEDIYPSGIVSIVSDTWDLWHVVDNIIPALKNKIMSRDGRVVIRPDSGNPVEIIAGKLEWEMINGIKIEKNTKGLIEKLWDIFGGTINAKGYRELDPHIGVIYGDSITLGIARTICETLKQKGFASTNIIFGIGSYTYQYNTRDTLGWAVKTTYCEINGIGKAITKDPKTDDGTKKSHSGLLKVIKDDDGNYKCLQNQTWEQFYQDDNELKLVFKDGKYF
jgi:nicotinamide phosphoribosyltransferase